MPNSNMAFPRMPSLWYNLSVVPLSALLLVPYLNIAVAIATSHLVLYNSLATKQKYQKSPADKMIPIFWAVYAFGISIPVSLNYATHAYGFIMDYSAPIVLFSLFLYVNLAVGRLTGWYVKYPHQDRSNESQQ